MRRNRIKTTFGLWVANHMPRWLVYWVLIRVWSEATIGGSAVAAPEVTLSAAVKDWE